MTSRYKHLRLRACVWLSIGAQLSLNTPALIQQAFCAQLNVEVKHQMLAQVNQIDRDRKPPPVKKRHHDSVESSASQTERRLIDEDSASSPRTYQGMPAGSQDDADMPGARMRKRFGDYNSAADLPSKPARAGKLIPAGKRRQADEITPKKRKDLNGAEQSGDLPWKQQRSGPDGGPRVADEVSGFRAGTSRREGAAQRTAQGGAFGNRSLDLTPLLLDDEQKDKVRQMRQQTKFKIRELRKSVQAKQDELRQLMFNPDASDEQIRLTRSQLRKLQDQVDETNMNDLLSIRAMLTAEQRKRWPDCMPGANGRASAASNFANGTLNPAPPPADFAGGRQ